jgi:dihydrolipoamide dehydrogenase
MESRVVPRAVYTHPEIGAVGLNEIQARSTFSDLKIGRLPFAASGKAITNEDTVGFVKVMADGVTGQIVGISMVGADVTNLLGEATLAVQMELTLKAVMQTIHAHPTLTEALAEAAHDAYNYGAIHLAPKKQPTA